MISSSGPREIGYWRKHEPIDFMGITFSPPSELPNPAKLVDNTWDMKERILVAAYLRCGRVAEAWMGYSTCRMCGKQDNGSTDLTDDAYIWPEGFAHYLIEHGVKPPQEFIDHALARMRQKAS